MLRDGHPHELHHMVINVHLSGIIILRIQYRMLSILHELLYRHQTDEDIELFPQDRFQDGKSLSIALMIGFHPGD